MGTLLACAASAVMYVSMTTMLWYFVKSGATQQTRENMLSFFFEPMITTARCNTGMLVVSISLLVTAAKGNTCLPKCAWLVNSLSLTLVAAIIFARMGAMNVGSALMFLGIYFLIKIS